MSEESQRINLNDGGAHVQIDRNSADSFTVEAVKAPNNATFGATRAELKALRDLIDVVLE